MWLVIGEPGDPCTAWLTDGLADIGDVPVIGLTLDDILDARLDHWLDGGKSAFRIRLEEGPDVCSRSVTGVVNRSAGFAPRLSARAEPIDAAYAAQEAYALFWSLLQSVDAPVLNPPIPADFGAVSHPFHWRRIAAMADLRPLDIELNARTDQQASADVASSIGTMRRVFVVDGLPLQPVPQRLFDGLAHFQALARLRLMAVDFVIYEPQGKEDEVEAFDDWHFVGVERKPDLRLAGRDLFQAFKSVFEGHKPKAVR